MTNRTFYLINFHLAKVSALLFDFNLAKLSKVKYTVFLTADNFHAQHM